MYEYIIILRLNICKLYTIKPLQMQWLYIYLFKKYDLINQVLALGHI